MRYYPHTLAFLCRLYKLSDFSVRYLLSKRNIYCERGDEWELANQVSATMDDLAWCIKLQRGRRRLKALAIVACVALAVGIVALLRLA